MLVMLELLDTLVMLEMLDTTKVPKMLKYLDLLEVKKVVIARKTYGLGIYRLAYYI